MVGWFAVRTFRSNLSAGGPFVYQTDLWWWNLVWS